jgi:hypothetical protein
VAEAKLTNIERFNAYATYILAKMYADFPVARKFEAKEVVDALKLPRMDPNNETAENNFAAHTNTWLAETGYLLVRPGATKDRFVLAPKAFEALAAQVPEALQPKTSGKVEPKKTIGDRMSEVSAEIGEAAAGEAKKKLTEASRDLVGFVIGSAITYAKTHLGLEFLMDPIA